MHFGCCTNASLARMAKAGGHKIASDVKEQWLDEIKKAFKKAQKAVEKNPPRNKNNLPKHAKKTELSKRIITRGLRSDGRRKAHFHKQYDAYVKRANFLAQKHVQQKIDKAERDVEKIRAKLKKSEAEAKTQKSRADEEEAETKRVIAILARRDHTKETVKFVKRIGVDAYYKLQRITGSEKLDMLDVLIRSSEFMTKYPKVESVFKDFIESTGANGEEVLGNLHALAIKKPTGYLGHTSWKEVYEMYKERFDSMDDEGPHALDDEVNAVMDEIMEVDGGLASGSRSKSTSK